LFHASDAHGVLCCLEVSPQVNPYSSRSRSPLAVGLTVARRLCPRPESTNYLLQVGFSTFHPQNQPVTTGVSPHLSPFTCWQCYLLCRAVPLECSQTTTTNSWRFYTSTSVRTPANRDRPEEQMRNNVWRPLAQIISEETLQTSLHPTKTNRPKDHPSD
jgi:hypothetical protein